MIVRARADTQGGARGHLFDEPPKEKAPTSSEGLLWLINADNVSDNGCLIAHDLEGNGRIGENTEESAYRAEFDSACFTEAWRNHFGLLVEELFVSD